MLAATQTLPALNSVKVGEPVILAGFAPSRVFIEELDPAIELWSVNNAWTHFSEERLAAVFELHPAAHLKQHAYYANKTVADRHIEWLGQDHPYPIYLIEETPDIPAGVRYPIEAALELAPRRYFASSMAYQMAFAMLTGRNPIYVYGYDMAMDTEWFYQRPNCEWWIGLAEGKGFTVNVAQQSPLCQLSKMYGYEGYQMVDRGVLEHRKIDYTKQRRVAIEQFDKWQGILMERHRLNRPAKEIEEAAKQVRLYENTASMCDGALQAVHNLLDECDLVPSEIPVFGMTGVRGRGLE